MVLVSSISKFFTKKTSLANKWMSFSSSNSALAHFTKYLIAYCIPANSFSGNQPIQICSCRNISIFYLINWIFAGEAIQGRKLFKGGNYSRKYGILNRSRFLVSFVSLIQYQTDLFTCSPLTKDCSTRIYSESMSVYGGQCILLITSKNFIGPLNLNLKKSRVWFTILCKILKKKLGRSTLRNYRNQV